MMPITKQVVTLSRPILLDLTRGMAEFDLPLELVDEINLAAVACEAATDKWTEKTPDRPRFIAGSIDQQPNKSISTNVEDPAHRDITFQEMRDSYRSQVDSWPSGVDILLPETAIDTLNLKACLFTIQDYFNAGGRKIPVMVSERLTKWAERL